MIRISLCMIVKNEERVLARCLDSIADLMDEIIIVDTGSTDRTKEIARRYTEKIYDFPWIDDFSAARNFAFSKATREYIYTADADEVLDEENRRRFRCLKECLLPEIDLVQMEYGNQLSHGTVYNFDRELRPKLFKRLREFVWEGAVHEMVRLEPLIYDSDIVVTHLPEKPHGDRDLANFRGQVQRGIRLNARLHNMYARELYMVGTPEDLKQAIPYFVSAAEDVGRGQEELVQSCCVLTKAFRDAGEVAGMWKYASKVIAGEGCSEVCLELGLFYETTGDDMEAAVWFYNAAFETEPALSIASRDDLPLKGLSRCYERMGLEDEAAKYRREWKNRKGRIEE